MNYYVKICQFVLKIELKAKKISHVSCLLEMNLLMFYLSIHTIYQELYLSKFINCQTLIIIILYSILFINYTVKI